MVLERVRRRRARRLSSARAVSLDWREEHALRGDALHVSDRYGSSLGCLRHGAARGRRVPAGRRPTRSGRRSRATTPRTSRCPRSASWGRPRSSPGSRTAVLDRGHRLGHVPDIARERRRERRGRQGRRGLGVGRSDAGARADAGGRTRDRVRGHSLDQLGRPADRTDRLDPQRRRQLDSGDDDRDR